MKRYIYTARDKKGKIVKGELAAVSEDDLYDKVYSLGYFLTKFQVSQTSDAGKVSTESEVSRMKLKDVLNFTIQLATLIDAGLPLMDTLKSISLEAENEKMKRIADDLYSLIAGGVSLEKAMSFYPKIFSKLYTSIIRTGESTGKLGEVLNNLSELLEWQMDLRSKVKEAATYPTILFFAMVGVVTLLVVRVVPLFKPIFDAMHTALPLPTQIVLGISYFVRSFWYVVAGGVILLIVGYKCYYRTTSGRYLLDGLKLKLPIFGKLIRKIVLSRFAHVFALTLKSGVNLLECLDIARDTIGNCRIEQSIDKAKDSVKAGGRLAESLKISGEFPPMVINMIGVGEKSGSLNYTISKVSDFYNKEVAVTIKRIFTLVEPIMIVVMGGIVALIALSVFIPMFKMTQMVGK